MKVLVATHQGQGIRKSDFCWTTDGELLVFPWVCDRDINNPDPDGGCGCGRALTGMLTHKSTTTFLVEDQPITGQEFTDLYLGAMQDAGWLNGDGDETEFRSALAADAAELLRLASAFEVGDVLEKRKDVIRTRKIDKCPKQPHTAPH